MKWSLEPRDGVIIVQMNSNPVNKMNPDFFNDLQETFNILDRDYPRLPLILTGQKNIFSAGIDFDYSFSLFEKRDLGAIEEWYRQFSEAILRVFVSERLTVAAINGHAFAGGLILALCCDFRIAAQGDAKFSLNEVPIGIPMPSIYTEIIRHRVGSAVATEAILTGKVYGTEDSMKMGFLGTLVSQEKLMEICLQQTHCIGQDAYPAYIQSKKILLHPVLERIDRYSSILDKETFKVISQPESVRAQRRALEQLKKRSK